MIVSSQIARGLDIFEITPSPYLTQNEIDAANTVQLDYLNAQGQPTNTWPATFALTRAYTGQLERSGGFDMARLTAIRQALSAAERLSGPARAAALNGLAGELEDDASSSSDAAKVRVLAEAVRELAAS